jgi:hypothetical protein
MSYRRVIPRDLFNEANFLKCVGRVSLLINDGLAPEGLQIHHAHAERGFLIVMDPGSGDLLMSNMYLTNKHGRKATFYRSLNSRDEWPIFVMDEHEDDEIEVFDSVGEFSSEFLTWTDTAK